MSRSAKRPKTVNQIVNGAHFRRFYIPEGGPKLSREVQSISNNLAEGLWIVQTSFKDLHYDDGPLDSETQVMMQACLQNAAQQIGRQFHVVPVTGMEAISFTLLLRKEYCEDWNLKYAAKFNKTMPKQAKMAVKSDLAVIDRNLVKKTRSRKGLNRSEITQLALEAWALQLGREQQGLSEKPISYGLLTDSRTLYVLKYDAGSKQMR